MRFLFTHSKLGSRPPHHPLQMLGPVLRALDRQTPTAAQPPPPRRWPPGTIRPRSRFQGGRPRPLPPLGLRERRLGSGSSAEHRGLRAAERAPLVLGPVAASRGGSRAGRRGRAGGARRPQKRGLPPPPEATPPPAPAACARVSVCLSSLSTSVGISSQEVRE